MLKSLSDLHKLAKANTKKRLVLAAAHDADAMAAVTNAYKNGIIDVVLVGDEKKITVISKEKSIDLSPYEVINEPEVNAAAEVAVRMVSEKKADIVMKGNLGTANLLRAVLNKEWGLRSGELLSHLALFEVPEYHKIIALTDAAMNIAPDIQGKVSLIKNAVGYLNKLGISNPKAALLSAAETVNFNMKSSTEAAILAKMNDRGQIKNCVLDGPLAFDNAISEKSAKKKGIKSPVAGDADLLIADDIDAANAIYKTFIYFSKAEIAAVIVGAKAPIVLTSRADTDKAKLDSIALAAAV